MQSEDLWAYKALLPFRTATVLQEFQDPPNVPHSPASTQVKPLHGPRQVWQLAKWLEVEILRFNETFSERALSSPLLEFLLLATKSARQLHSKAFYELAKQVRQPCTALLPNV